MIPTFPQRPALLMDGYNVKPVSRARRTEFENGIDKQHVTHNRQMVERDVTYFCCDAECFEELRKFIRDDCANGTSWFLWHSPEHANLNRQGVIRSRIKNGDVTYTPDMEDFTAWKVKFTLEHYDTNA
jgi:hypothetical protein